MVNKFKQFINLMSIGTIYHLILEAKFA